MEKSDKIKYFDSIAKVRDRWKKRNWYYHKELEKFLCFVVIENSSILEIGCGTGDTVNSLKPSRGVGIDISPEMIKIAKGKYPQYNFIVGDAENLLIDKKFDFVIMSDLVGHLTDVWQVFRNLNNITNSDTRIVVTYFNHLWEPILTLAEKLKLKIPQHCQNWLSLDDIENLLNLNNYEVIKRGSRLLLPKHIPVISDFVNRYIAKLPILRKLCLIQYIIAKEKDGRFQSAENYSCSVIIPCKDEVGNIEDLVKRTPKMGKWTELIFIDGNSTDGTIEKIKETMGRYKEKRIKLIHQGESIGKGDAVRKGFAQASGDILMILDADITVPPEDLPKFYLALAERKGELISGTRLVYPMEKSAMRPLNILGNKIFSMIFTWILEQRIKDTLCGTKAIFHKDYLKIVKGRGFFGDFDPFGDFDLLFGAAKRNLKIVEIPVRYKERKYGNIKIRRFRHGCLLLKMCFVAFKKLKLG